VRRLLLAQIMSRLNLTWLGEPGPQVATRNTFKVVVMLLAAYTVYSLSLEVASMGYSANNLPPLLWGLKTLGSVLFSVYSIYSLCQTRRSVRMQYSIPEERCAGCEDCCCATFCTFLSLAQMARHTGEYETYPGVFLSKTGHPKGTPLTV
jgi:Cys-rich protein (TIGR01571 family)